jgi:steroid 5-alpha reductase family enzyme
MSDAAIFVQGLLAIAPLAIAGWVVGTAIRNVSIVDILWSLFFLVATIAYALQAPTLSERAVVVLVLVAIWAVRLGGYIAWRNHGKGEDHRYQAIRRNNEPNFALKSAYLVFGLQGVLAWLISLPLFAAVIGDRPLGALDFAGIGLWLIGFLFEAVGDWQLAMFKREPANAGQVMDRGLWRYTRHPNYFGECCLWWGYFLLACGAGAPWTILSPILMTVLLLRVSGVSLLEKSMLERRPAYRDYVHRTSAFLPAPPRPTVSIAGEAR